MSSARLPRLNLCLAKSAELMAGRSVILRRGVTEPAIVTIQQSREGLFCFIKLLTGQRFFAHSPGGRSLTAAWLCYQRCLAQWASSRELFRKVQVGKRYLLANAYSDLVVSISAVVIASPRGRFFRYLLISPGG